MGKETYLANDMLSVCKMEQLVHEFKSLHSKYKALGNKNRYM